MSRIKPSNYALITSLKQPKPVYYSEIVGRLHRKALKLQKLRSVASEQVMDAELAYEALTRQCKEAWNEYHAALKREPANESSSATTGDSDAGRKGKHGTT